MSKGWQKRGEKRTFLFNLPGAGKSHSPTSELVLLISQWMTTVSTTRRMTMADRTMNSSIVWMMTDFNISAASLNSKLNASALANSSFG